MITRLRFSLFILISLFTRVVALASPSEGVYIEEKGSVVFFSNAYQIVNLKSEDKMIFFHAPKSIKKKPKATKVNKKENVSQRVVKITKIEEKKIPLKLQVFNVKNSKKKEITVLQSSNILHTSYIINFSEPLFGSNFMVCSYFLILYGADSQSIALFFYSMFSSFAYNGLIQVFLLLITGLFFYAQLSLKSKFFASNLNKGPPYCM